MEGKADMSSDMSEPRAEDGVWRRRVLLLSSILCLGVLHWVVAVRAISTKCVTFDEVRMFFCACVPIFLMALPVQVAHVSGGVAQWLHNDYRLNAEVRYVV